MNHGHVIPNPDGSKARCGGPAICAVCSLQFASIEKAKPKTSINVPAILASAYFARLA